MKEITRAIVAYQDIVLDEEFNSRKNYVEIDELAESLEQHGLIQPLVVREGGPSKDGKRRKYFLVAGGRRYRAIGQLVEKNPQRWSQVEVKIVKGSAKDNAARNLIENLQRKDLEPLEEARGMLKFMEAFGVNQTELAAEIGKSEPYISQRLTLLKNTAPEVKAALELPKNHPEHITPTHAREMVTLPQEEQKEVLKKIQAKQAKGEKVSVSEVKDETDKRKSALGIKRDKEPKKKSNGESYDTTKVKMAREIFEGNIRPKTALLEMIGVLVERSKRPNISDDTKRATKAQLAFAEYIFGMRDSL